MTTKSKSRWPVVVVGTAVALVLLMASPFSRYIGRDYDQMVAWFLGKITGQKPADLDRTPDPDNRKLQFKANLLSPQNGVAFGQTQVTYTVSVPVFDQKVVHPPQFNSKVEDYPGGPVTMTVKVVADKAHPAPPDGTEVWCWVWYNGFEVDAQKSPVKGGQGSVTCTPPEHKLNF